MNRLLGTILIERGFDLICYVMVVIITIALQMNLVGKFVREKMGTFSNPDAMGFVIPVLLIITLTFFVITLTRSIFEKFAHLPFFKSVSGFFLGLWQGFRTIKVLRSRGTFISHTVFIWSMYLLQIYVAFSALSTTSHLGMIEAASVQKEILKKAKARLPLS
jgi:hypothetical protein